MLIFEEVEPLPQECQECEEVEEWGTDCACYNCDYALKRFKMIRVEDD